MATYLLTGKNYSEKTAELIDEEVKKLLTSLYDEAKNLLARNRGALDRIADRIGGLATLIAGPTLGGDS